MIRRIAVAVVVFMGLWLDWGVVGWTAEEATVRPAAPKSKGDMYCGPRCVQFVLDHFRSKVELIDLVREMQWPNVEAGTTLETVRNALTSRGVYTAALDIAPHARLDWPHPVIVHLNASRGKLGHYVVWLPEPPRNEVVLWTGLAGYHQGSEKQFQKLRSGAILLTSPTPIAHPESAIADRPAQWPVLASGLAVAVAAGMISLRLRHGYRFRKLTRRSPNHEFKAN